MARKWTPKDSLSLHWKGGRKLADHRPERRKCLGRCGKMFASKGPANRICERCAELNDRLCLSRWGG